MNLSQWEVGNGRTTAAVEVMKGVRVKEVKADKSSLM